MPIAINGTGTISGVSAGGLTSASNGRVLQVRELMLTTYTSNGNFSSETNTGYQDVSGYTLSITPSSASSKIIVMVNTWISSQRIWMRVVRDSTVIGVGDAVGGVNQQAGMYNHVTQGLPIAYQWMDSPNTTSSVNYKVQIGGETNITAAFIGAAQATQSVGPQNQYPSLVRTMLLWEIAA
jgi:hypothetical protein